MQKERVNRSQFIKRIVQLREGTGFDWDSSGFSYHVQKVCWKDSCLVLIGGYGGETISCFLPCSTLGLPIAEQTEDAIVIEQMVNRFFDDLQNISHDEILVSGIKAECQFDTL